MLLKLAFRNCIRSFKDYLIYFATLVFGVAIFYAFNAIGSQQILFDATTFDTTQVFEIMSHFMSIFSVAIACVLGFLIIYANGFLFKRRSHEFATYLILGMRNSSISLVILFETLFVGLVSLVVGLVLGVVLSQFFSLFTAQLLGQAFKSYQFIFSFESLKITVLCFVVIYLIVLVVNLIKINNSKLVTLLFGKSQTLIPRLHCSLIAVSAFVFSIVLLVIAYAALHKNGLVTLGDNDFKVAFIGMLIGTLLLFWSLGSVFVSALSHIRATYFHSLNMFTIRQLSYKLGFSSITLWACCIMLFFGLSALSVGLGLGSIFKSDSNAMTQYDASIVLYNSEQNMSFSDDISSALYEADCFNDNIDQSSRIDLWSAPNTDYYDLVLQLGLQDDYPSDSRGQISMFGDGSYVLIGESQFNEMLSLTDETPLNLDDDTFAVVNTFEYTKKLAQEVVDKDQSILVAGQKLHPLKTINEHELYLYTMPMTSIVFVVPDGVIANVEENVGYPQSSFINFFYTSDINTEKGDEFLSQLLYDTIDSINEEKGDDSVVGGQFLSARMMLTSSNGLSLLMNYLAIYVGIILLISSAAILAIQVLSEMIDSLPRYKTLYQLGCDVKTVALSLFIQIAVYFGAPLLVALCHSSFVAYILHTGLFKAFSSSMSYLFLTLGVLTICYGAYFCLTYLAARGMLKSSLKH